VAAGMPCLAGQPPGSGIAEHLGMDIVDADLQIGLVHRVDLRSSDFSIGRFRFP
jgi:hypothetical protein